MKGQNVWSNQVYRFSKKTHIPRQNQGSLTSYFTYLRDMSLEPESFFQLSNGGQQHWNLWACNSKIKPLSAGFLSNTRGIKKGQWALEDHSEVKCLLLASFPDFLARRFWFSPGAVLPRRTLSCSTMCGWALGVASLLPLPLLGNLFLPQQKTICFSPTPRALTDPMGGTSAPAACSRNGATPKARGWVQPGFSSSSFPTPKEEPHR